MKLTVEQNQIKMFSIYHQYLVKQYCQKNILFIVDEKYKFLVLNI